MKITIESIPHKHHRYETVGDWFWRKKHLVIRVSKMKNPDYILLVAIHELVEAWLCFRRGISERSVTKFDKEFEEKRSNHQFLGGVSEPGDHPEAPYFDEHQFATKIERMVAEELEINWRKYEKTLDSL